MHFWKKKIRFSRKNTKLKPISVSFNSFLTVSRVSIDNNYIYFYAYLYNLDKHEIRFFFWIDDLSMNLIG